MTYDIVLSKDTSVRSSEPYRNYSHSDLFYVNKISNDEFESLIQFDTSGIDEHNGVFAELRMYQYSSASGGTIDINRITETWNEPYVTWHGKPTFDTNVLKIYSYGNGWTDIGIKQIVATFIDGTLTNYGFYLRNISILDDMVSYRSSNYSENRPHVRIYEHSDYGYNYESPMFDVYDMGSSYEPYYITLHAYAHLYDSFTEQSEPYTTRFNIRTPWSSTIHDEFLDEGETVTYSQSGTGYTEYFTFEYVFTAYDNEIGYNPVMKAYWYRDYDDTYVSLDGDDDNNGFDWDNAYRTVTKGTTEVKDGSTVYIDEGIYASESDAFPDGKSYNFELRDTANYIIVSGESLTTDSSGYPWIVSSEIYETDSVATTIDLSGEVTHDGHGYEFEFDQQTSRDVILRPMIFRPENGQYKVVYAHDTIITIPSTHDRIIKFPINTEVRNGDLFGAVWYTTQFYTSVNTNGIIIKSGEVLSDTEQSEWNVHSVTRRMAMQLNYLYWGTKWVLRNTRGN